MNEETYGYGYWSVAVFNIAVFAFFAIAYIRPQTKLDWRSLGVFMGFVVAFFTEMYGFPFTIYLFSGWLSHRYPNIDLFSHHYGRLWQTIFELQSTTSFYTFFVVSNVFIWGGVIFLGWCWKILHRAQRAKKVASQGPYRWMRHPQYAAFIIIMIGFLIQWPTLPTLILFPVLIITYAQLAKREERESLKMFGDAYLEYQKRTPRFLPFFRRSAI